MVYVEGGLKKGSPGKAQKTICEFFTLPTSSVAACVNIVYKDESERSF